MSVLKRNRKKSPFEVIHHFYKLRKEITDLLLRDFGYSEEKAIKKYEGRFGGKTYGELTESNRKMYDRYKARCEAFDDWYVMHEREIVMECLQNICKELTIANSIYPCYEKELIERRLHQDLALGECHRLEQELRSS